MTKPPSLLRVCCVTGICAGITLLLAAISIWLGILAMPILYEVAESLLE